jgi:glycine/D-amino acid oxidase-like deaminating enzyme
VSGPRVAVFGAGIAGLTAAHELAARGFQVVVYERAGETGAGGVAASQWHSSTRLFDPRTGEPLRLPGEHGFRVFQSYYRHCEDTMKRIPGDGRARVFDHLVSTYKTGHAVDDGVRPWAFDRRRPRSLAGALQFGLVVMHGLGWDARDHARLGLKLAQHMTSSSARRMGEYERQSLWEYFDVPRFSPRAQRHLASLYRLLLAMDLRRADARTQNNIAVRVAMEQMLDGAAIDRVLDGPTSERWFRPWVRHLRELGVTFQFDTELRRFEIADGTIACATVGRTGQAGAQRVEADYYVSDLPVGPLAAGARAFAGTDRGGCGRDHAPGAGAEPRRAAAPRASHERGTRVPRLDVGHAVLPVGGRAGAGRAPAVVRLGVGAVGGVATAVLGAGFSRSSWRRAGAWPAVGGHLRFRTAGTSGAQVGARMHQRRDGPRDLAAAGRCSVARRDREGHIARCGGGAAAPSLTWTTTWTS